MYKFLVRFR